MMSAISTPLLEPDEITYIEAGRLYVSSLLEGKIFAPWWFNFEHPALVKYLIGLSVILLPLPTYIAARMPSVILGSLTCVLMYFLGKALFSEQVGLISSILLTFNVLSIVGSKQAMLEAPLTFFSVLSLLLLYSSLQDGSSRAWLLSGVSFGLALTCKFSAVFLILVCIPYVFVKEKSRRKATLLILVWLGIGGLVFYALQPGYWLNPAGTLWESMSLYWRRAQRGRWYDTYFMGETYDAPPIQYLIVLMLANSNPLEAIALLSGVFLFSVDAARRHLTEETGFLALMVLSPFLYLSLIPLKLTHYLVMCMPSVMLLAAYGMKTAYKPTIGFKGFSVTFISSVLLLFSIASVIESYPSFFYYNPILGKDNYAYLVGHPGGGVEEAVAWIRQNVPKDTRIGLIGFDEEFHQRDSDHTYVQFNYRCSLHYVRDVNKIRYLVVQINMAERVQNPLWKTVQHMDPIFTVTVRGMPAILIFDFGPRQ